ncbi:DUF3290 domain-containing protein [Enterococcus saccharolyticus]|uniref:DUF3290 domain-containing protein n=1 Tax=Candidatus Enterococcus willemsii TaxID=1857215 RepID=A0ABQ6Z1J2_9ENTE|nr:MULTISPECIES: DUF3290 domain-containing protein [Enterococcus]KAF1305335.1 hypothetical protein BAU17_13210 [Enterococcus sp. CU12B]MCD5002973.1 DUF3290 domain-containing protein [Enterococcus saccharolyticus]
MSFYGIHYLENRGNISDMIKYIVIFAVLIFFVFVFIRYLRSRIQSKYRDLSLILFLSLLFLIGMQYSEYRQAEAQDESFSQMAGFLHTVADQRGVSVDKVYVNSLTLTDEALFLIDDQYYVLHLSNDRNSFRLEPTYLTNTNTTIEE